MRCFSAIWERPGGGACLLFSRHWTLEPGSRVLQPPSLQKARSWGRVIHVHPRSPPSACRAQSLQSLQGGRVPFRLSAPCPLCPPELPRAPPAGVTPSLGGGNPGSGQRSHLSSRAASEQTGHRAAIGEDGAVCTHVVRRLFLWARVAERFHNGSRMYYRL